MCGYTSDSCPGFTFQLHFLLEHTHGSAYGGVASGMIYSSQNRLQRKEVYTHPDYFSL